jgi:hypothetical protein
MAVAAGRLLAGLRLDGWWGRGPGVYCVAGNGLVDGVVSEVAAADAFAT